MFTFLCIAFATFLVIVVLERTGYRFRLLPGDRIGPAFLKVYTPGDQFVLLRYWPVWSVAWWRSLWLYRHTMRHMYLEWTDRRSYGLTQYISFGFPIWFFWRTESKAWNHFGKNRGKHLLVVRGMFQVWPLWPTKMANKAHIETLLYPVGPQEAIHADLFRSPDPVPTDVQ